MYVYYIILMYFAEFAFETHLTCGCVGVTIHSRYLIQAEWSRLAWEKIQLNYNEMRQISLSKCFGTCRLHNVDSFGYVAARQTSN